LGAFHPRSSRRALRALEQRGVEVRLGTSVRCVGADFVELSDGSRIDTQTLIWTAGIQASGLGRTLGVELDKGGRVPVGSDLSMAEDGDVFVIGDLAGARDHAGHLYPQLAPVAMQQGRHAARQIERRISGQAPEPF